MPKKVWTPEEDQVIRKHYPAHGMGCDWAALLPGRTMLAIQHRASDIGVFCIDKRRRKPAWSAAEMEAIRKHYPTHGPHWAGWAEHLPGRSEKQIAWKAQNLKVRFLFGPRCKRKDSCATAPREEDPVTPPAILGHSGATWTDVEREKLLEHALACVKVTGHPISECAVELARIVAEWRECGAA